MQTPNYLIRNPPFKKDFQTVKQRLEKQKQESLKKYDNLDFSYQQINKTESTPRLALNQSKQLKNDQDIINQNDFQDQLKSPARILKKQYSNYFPPLRQSAEKLLLQSKYLNLNDGNYGYLKSIMNKDLEQKENKKQKKNYFQESKSYSSYLLDLSKRSLAPVEKTEFLTLERKAILSHKQKIEGIKQWKNQLEENYAVSQLIKSNQSLKTLLKENTNSDYYLNTSKNLLRPQYDLRSYESLERSSADRSQKNTSFASKKTVPQEIYILHRKQKTNKLFSNLVQTMDSFEDRLMKEKQQYLQYCQKGNKNEQQKIQNSKNPHIYLNIALNNPKDNSENIFESQQKENQKQMLQE